MKSSIIVSFVLLLINCHPKVDCVKIDMPYNEVIKNCGRPDKHTYRANHLDKITYYKIPDDLTFEFVIGFNREEKVNFYKYRSQGLEKVEYTEAVE